MASSLHVMSASRTIFESIGVKAEGYAATYRHFVPAQTTEMDVDSCESSQEEESDEGKIETNIPVFLRIPFLLQDLEAISMILKLCLRRLHLTEQVQSKNLQDIEHKIYEIQEAVMKPYKAFLASNISKDIEDLKLLHHYRERLYEGCDSLIKEMRKVNFQITEEDNKMLNNETVRVCSLLGLRLDFLDPLEKLPSEIRDHRTLSDWIVIFLRNNYKTLGLKERNSFNKEHLYHEIGFDPLSSAVETILTRAGSMQEHIEVCDWAEIFIKDEFKYNVLLCQHISTFPFRSDKTNEWFVWPGDDDHCHVNIINLVTKKSKSSFTTRSKLSDFKLEDKQHTVLFHGTDHESASDILSGRGIHLGAGRQKRDFSSGGGFYLTTKLDDALSWANNTTGKPAILVFRVDLKKARKLNLTQDDGYKRWREIVTSFRLDKETAKIRNSLSAYDLIEGPLATAKRSGPPNDGELMFYPKPFSYQMCLISDDFVEKCEQALHSVLFYDLF